MPRKSLLMQHKRVLMQKQAALGHACALGHCHRSCHRGGRLSTPHLPILHIAIRALFPKRPHCHSLSQNAQLRREVPQQGHEKPTCLTSPHSFCKHDVQPNDTLFLLYHPSYFYTTNASRSVSFAWNHLAFVPPTFPPCASLLHNQRSAPMSSVHPCLPLLPYQN